MPNGGRCASDVPTRRNCWGAFSLVWRDPVPVLRSAGDASQALPDLHPVTRPKYVQRVLDYRSACCDAFSRVSVPTRRVCSCLRHEDAPRLETGVSLDTSGLRIGGIRLRLKAAHGSASAGRGAPRPASAINELLSRSPPSARASGPPLASSTQTPLGPRTWAGFASLGRSCIDGCRTQMERQLTARI